MTSRLVLASLVVLLSACQQDTAVPADASSEGASAPAASSPDGPGADSGTPSVPAVSVVPAEQMAALLPARIGDAERGEVISNTDGAMGLNVSRASALYGGEGGVTLLVLDVGSAEGARLMGLTVVGTDRLGGHPVRRSESGAEPRVQIQVGERYIVEASGAGASMERLDEFVQAVDLSGLPSGA